MERYFGRPARKPELRSCTRCVHPLVPRVSGCRPPGRWRAAMEVPFLFRGFLYGRAAQRRPYKTCGSHYSCSLFPLGLPTRSR